MNALALLAECAAHDITLTPHGERLSIAGPRDAVTELRDQIVAAKLDLLALLSADRPTIGCVHCGREDIWCTSHDGSAWCRRCDHRRALLDLADYAGYPRLDLRPTMLFVVPPGPSAWLSFARSVTGATAYLTLRRLKACYGGGEGSVRPSDAPGSLWQG